MTKRLRITTIPIGVRVLLLVAIAAGLELNARTANAQAQWSAGALPDGQVNSMMQSGNNQQTDIGTSNTDTSTQNIEQNQGNGLDANFVEGGRARSANRHDQLSGTLASKWRRV